MSRRKMIDFIRRCGGELCEAFFDTLWSQCPSGTGSCVLGDFFNGPFFNYLSIALWFSTRGL